MKTPKSVGIRELRQNLSIYVDRVQEGETLEVTDRGRPVAILGPLPGQGTRLERMVAQGLITKATRSPSGLGIPASPSKKIRPNLTEALRRLRSGER